MKFKQLTSEHLWIFLVLGVCFGYLCTQPVEQIDFWHYLKAGKIIFHTHNVLDTDQFSFTIFGKHYINVHWASQLIYYLLYEVGGIQLIVLMHAILITTAFLFLFLIVYSRCNSLSITSIAIFFAFILASSNFTLRPQGFSILCFILTQYFLGRKCLWIIPIILLMWANLHAACILGLVLILVKWICNLKDYKLLLCAFISFLATLINPWGIKLYNAIFTVEPISRTISNITEWETPSFHQPVGFMFYAALLLLITLQNIRKISWCKDDLLTFLVFTFFAFSSLRFVLWWSIISAPLFALVLKDLCPLKDNKQNIRKGKSLYCLFIAFMFSVFLIGCLPWLKINNPILPENKRALISPDTPILLAEELHKHLNIHNIFNNYAWGSYFIWTLRKDQKVFYDPRVVIFPQNIIQNYFYITRGHSWWQRLLDYYKVDTLALSHEEQSGLIALVKESNSWEKIYEDKLGIIFTRAKPH